MFFCFCFFKTIQLQRLIFALFTYVNRYVRFKRHCPHTSMHPLHGLDYWAILPLECSAEFRDRLKVPMSVSDSSQHGDSGGDHNNVRSEKETLKKSTVDVGCLCSHQLRLLSSFYR